MVLEEFLIFLCEGGKEENNSDAVFIGTTVNSESLY